MSCLSHFSEFLFFFFSEFLISISSWPHSSTLKGPRISHASFPSSASIFYLQGPLGVHRPHPDNPG